MASTIPGDDDMNHHYHHYCIDDKNSNNDNDNNKWNSIKEDYYDIASVDGVAARCHNNTNNMSRRRIINNSNSCNDHCHKMTASDSGNSNHHHRHEQVQQLFSFIVLIVLIFSNIGTTNAYYSTTFNRPFTTTNYRSNRLYNNLNELTINNYGRFFDERARQQQLKIGSSPSQLSLSSSSMDSSSNNDSSSSTSISTSSNSMKPSTLFQSSSTTSTTNNKELSKLMSSMTRIGMILFIISMCIALPITLLPLQILFKLNIISRTQKEKYSLSTGRWCSYILLKCIPFVNVTCIRDPPNDNNNNKNNNKIAEPSIWVCNHTSMLDVFILMAYDRQLRNVEQIRRPIKIVYWKNLEDNPITKMLFVMSGFIPVDMKANAPGEENQYDKKSFKSLLKACKDAFASGFDVGILPEGQLNPTPEIGLLPIFSGAYTLAKMSSRPIYMIGLYNIHQLWHPVHGMICTARNIKLRCYQNSGKIYNNGPSEFINTFTNVIGYFGKTGNDLPVPNNNNIQEYILSSSNSSITTS